MEKLPQGKISPKPKWKNCPKEKKPQSPNGKTPPRKKYPQSPKWNKTLQRYSYSFITAMTYNLKIDRYIYCHYSSPLSSDLLVSNASLSEESLSSSSMRSSKAIWCLFIDILKAFPNSYPPSSISLFVSFKIF